MKINRTAKKIFAEQSSVEQNGMDAGRGKQGGTQKLEERGTFLSYYYIKHYERNLSVYLLFHFKILSHSTKAIFIFGDH